MALNEWYWDIGGIDTHKLKPGTAITVTTEGSTYKIVVKDNEEITIEGGRMKDGSLRYPSPTPAVFVGSLLNGFLKPHWIGFLMKMEFYDGHTFVITSKVRSAALDRLE